MQASRVGLIGLGKGGHKLLDVLLPNSWCELAAVASPRTQRLERFSEDHPQIATYDDFRSLIVENELDALFVAAPPYLRNKYLELAARRQLPVWMFTPPARSFEEAVNIMRLFDRHDCPLEVSRSWGIEPAFQQDHLDMQRVGKIFLARAGVMLCWQEDFDWRGDSHRAGGGVLLDQAYELIDMIVHHMGLPSTVYAVTAHVSRQQTRFPYDTEDTAAVVMRFTGGAMAALNACWTAGPPQWSLDLHGASGSLKIDPGHITCLDRTGQEVYFENPREANPVACQVEEFLTRLQSQPNLRFSSMREHLPAIAVIEAAYLSARTGQPESPATFFEMHDIRDPRGNG